MRQRRHERQERIDRRNKNTSNKNTSNKNTSNKNTSKPALQDMPHNIFSRIWSTEAAPAKGFINAVKRARNNQLRERAAQKIQRHVPTANIPQRGAIKVDGKYLLPKTIIQELGEIARDELINDKYKKMTPSEFRRVLTMYVRFTNNNNFNANVENIQTNLQSIVNANLYPAITQYKLKSNGNFKALHAAYKVRDNPEGSSSGDYKKDHLVMKIPYRNGARLHKISDKAVFHAIRQYIQNHPEITVTHPAQARLQGRSASQPVINKQKLKRYVMHYATYLGNIIN